jgi:hypothetical protein
MSVASSIAGGGGSSGSGVAQGSGTAIADDQAVRGDTSGIQGSAVTIDDNGRVTTPVGANGGFSFGDGDTYWYEAADDQPTLRRNGSDALDVVDIGGSVVQFRVNVNGGVMLAGAAGSNLMMGRSTEKFVFGGGNGTDWYAEGSGGASHWVAGAAGDFAPVSRGLRCYRAVEVSTAGSGAPNVLGANESRKLLTNEGATAEAYHTLPSAAAGLEYAFYCQDTDGIRIVAAAGDTIRLGAAVSATAGFVRSVAAGSALILTAINATEWVAISSPVGTWTVDV